MSGGQFREHSLLEVLTGKHYPQVFQVTRPYFANQRECLKRGQLITVLDRKKVNLVVGVDHEGREFYVRKDRQTNVELVEDERVAYNLSVVVPLAKHIDGVEFRKEIRFEKQTFAVGEIFTIEKVNKSFRGRTKSLALKRKKDNKVYRFPLDLIGMFKILSGKCVLPLSKILSLRIPPISVQFRNTPTSSNYPRGKVILREIIAVDIVYILTVRSEVYTYEAFLADPSILVEKSRLQIPKPILKIIPNGMLVNSPEYIHPIKTHYRQKISEIESRLTEDIYALTYYGSATFDKPTGEDSHLVLRPRFLTSASLDERSETASLSSNAPSTPDSEQGGAPLPYPRYSKKHKHRNPISFSAIIESDQWQMGASIGGVPTSIHTSADVIMKKQANIDELKKEMTNLNIDINDSHTRSQNGLNKESPKVSSQVRQTSKSCTNINRQCASEPSPKSFSKSQKDNRAIDARAGRQSEYQSTEFHSPRAYDIQNGMRYAHSCSSSIATEDSGDSGVILNYNNYANRNSPSSRSLNSASPSSRSLNGTSVDQSPLYASVMKGAIQHEENNPPPLPARESLYQNIHHRQVDIDIGDGDENAETRQDIGASYDDVRHSSYQRPYTNIDKELMRGQRSITPDSSCTNSTLSLSTTSSKCRGRSDEMQSMTQAEVGELLTKLRLETYVESFARELINGTLLKELDEATLINDLNMTQFQARKICNYVLGWRPILHEYPDKGWSVERVFYELQKINLTKLAFFCKANLIDGPLLKDLIENDFIQTLRSDHDISLTGIELSRLKAFVLKEWRPDKDTIKYQSSVEMERSPEKHVERRRSSKKSKHLWNRLMQQSSSSA